ncbi:MAG: ATP-binding protein [Planctomycetota bacterium]
MRRRHLIWRLYPPYLLITVASILVVTWYATHEGERLYLDATAAHLEDHASVVRQELASGDILRDPSKIDALCKRLGKVSRSRLTVIRRDGQVLGDSEMSPATMENHSGRPEIIKAVIGQTGRSIRFSRSVLQNMMYVAIPLEKGGEITVVRASRAVSSIDEALRGIYIRTTVATVVVLALAAAIGLVASKRLNRQIQFLTEGALRFARGKLNLRLPSFQIEEIETIAQSMNTMATELSQRIEAMAREKSEKDAMLSSMVEAVLAIDDQEHVIHLNQAAETLLNVSLANAKGKMVQEVIRSPELQRFVQSLLTDQQIVESEITFYRERDRRLQVRGAPLHDAENRQRGVLLVMNDVTELRKLEGIRRDFVANVSHELRTPITSIKGAVETLLEGALSDHERAQRFLGTIARQVDRLDSIVRDLLTLSRIERDQQEGDTEFTTTSIEPVLRDAIQACELVASNKKITVELGVEGDLKACINAPLVEQAVVNLLTNAIEYSDAGKLVIVGARPSGPGEAREEPSDSAPAGDSGGGITIYVKDEGCGIEQCHLPRLFERFYRVDRARSRTQGGTGLGLSIVKHIAQLHGGSVGVVSEPHAGSTFFIHLPAES